MTAYELPAEPDVDVLWTVPLGLTPGEDRPVTRWERDNAPVIGGRWTTSITTPRTWQELLDGRRVFDQHPDLDGVPPLPWAWHDVRGLIHANGGTVQLADDETGCLIVRAVNAYAAHLGGQS